LSRVKQKALSALPSQQLFEGGANSAPPFTSNTVAALRMVCRFTQVFNQTLAELVHLFPVPFIITPRVVRLPYGDRRLDDGYGLVHICGMVRHWRSTVRENTATYPTPLFLRRGIWPDN
jgi:hypothetical protein